MSLPLAASLLLAMSQTPAGRWTPPYRILPLEGRQEEIARRLGLRELGLWVEGKVVTVAARAEAKRVELTGGIQEPMQEAGPGVWAIRLEAENWDRVILSYAVIRDGKMGELRKMERHLGRSAPRGPQPFPQVKGRIVVRPFYSRALGEARNLTLYLPPEVPPQGLPVLYVADGAAVSSLGPRLERLMVEGRMRKIALAGVDSGSYRGDRSAPYDPSLDFRSKDYVWRDDPDWFARHMRFFTEEVPQHLELRHGLSSRPEDRALTGFSNGGAFTAAVAWARPRFASAFLPVSLGVIPEGAFPAEGPGGPPRLFFAAGSLERFSLPTKAAKDLAPGSTLDLYVAGHDFEVWALHLAKRLPEIFPA